MKIKKCPIKSGDIVIICAVFLTATILLLIQLYQFGNTAAKYVVVTYGETAEKYYLGDQSEDVSREMELKSEGYTLKLVISDGSAYISESDCPDGICRRSGKISEIGQSIVCVPARVIIKITAAGEMLYDTAVG